jgi:glycosyltransferase involved in cell wall biosynthesis
MKVCITIPAMLADEKLYNVTLRFLDSIDKRTTYPNYEVLIYDNNSDPKLTERLIQQVNNLKNKAKFRIKILKNYKFNLSQIYNKALKDSNAKLFVMANNDMEIINGEWLANIVKWFETTPKLGTCMPYQNILGNPLKFKPVNILKDHGDMCWFAIYAISRKAINAIGGFDEKVPLYFHDFDVHHTIKRQGYKALWAYNAIVRHYGDRTTINHPKSSKHSYDNAYHYVHRKHPGK